MPQWSELLRESQTSRTGWDGLFAKAVAADIKTLTSLSRYNQLSWPSSIYMGSPNQLAKQNKAIITERVQWVDATYIFSPRGNIKMCWSVSQLMRLSVTITRGQQVGMCPIFPLKTSYHSLLYVWVVVANRRSRSACLKCFLTVTRGKVWKYTFGLENNISGARRHLIHIILLGHHMFWQALREVIQWASL